MPYRVPRSAPIVFVVLSLVWFGARPHSAAAPQDALRIIVLEGEDAVNLIDKKTAVKPTVEVRDRNDLPVAGAVVIFAMRGRTAEFGSGLRQVTLTTDTLGRATVNAVTPVSKGAVEIQVQASYQGQTAVATIHQANFANAAQAIQAGKIPAQAGSSSAGSTAGTTAGTTTGAAGGGLSTAAIGGIVAGVAGGAAAAVAVAKSRSDSSTPSTTPTSVNPNTTSALTTTFNANPAPFSPSGCDPSFPAGWTSATRIAETAGVAFTPTQFIQRVDGSTNNILQVNFTRQFAGVCPGSPTAPAGTIPANGAVCGNLGVCSTPIGPNRSTYQFTLIGTDANGHTLTIEGPTLSLQPRPPSTIGIEPMLSPSGVSIPGLLQVGVPPRWR